MSEVFNELRHMWRHLHTLCPRLQLSPSIPQFIECLGEWQHENSLDEDGLALSSQFEKTIRQTVVLALRKHHVILLECISQHLHFKLSCSNSWILWCAFNTHRAIFSEGFTFVLNMESRRRCKPANVASRYGFAIDYVISHKPFSSHLFDQIINKFDGDYDSYDSIQTVLEVAMRVTIHFSNTDAYQYIHEQQLYYLQSITDYREVLDALTLQRETSEIRVFDHNLLVDCVTQLQHKYNQEIHDVCIDYRGLTPDIIQIIVEFI